MTSSLEIIYCGDHWQNRAKSNDSLLTHQAISSIQSLRSNWDTNARIIFLHTNELPKKISRRFLALNVDLVRCARSIEPDYLMANKILPIHLSDSKRDQLFLDCDTIIHKAIPIKRDAQILVSFDALFPMPIEVYEKAFRIRDLEIPKGKVFESPAMRFYLEDDIEQFPAWNAGIYYLNSSIRKPFYKCYLKSFRRLFETFRDSRNKFYIETLAFTTAVFELGLRVEYFEKGINFICTPRADALAFWPKSRILLEHYAGNTSLPLEFDGENIICPWRAEDK